MENKEAYSELKQMVDYGVKHKLFKDDASRAALMNWKYHNIDPLMVSILMGKVKKHQKEMAERNIPFDEPKLLDRGLQIGHDTTGKGLYIDPNWLHVGLICAGATGSGKSVWTKYLLCQLLFIVKVWSYELYKAEFRHFLAHPITQNLPITVVRPQDAKINELQADGDPRGHVSVTVDNIYRHLGIPSRGQTILRQAINGLYHQYGIYTKAKVDVWPTLFDVWVLIKKTKGLNAPAREAILDRLGAYLEAKNGAWRLGWRPSDLAKHSIIWEYNTASESQKGIELYYLIRAKLDHAVSSGIVNAPFQHAVVLDDAQRFLTTSGSDSHDVAPIEELLGVQRGCGTGVFPLVQSMQGISKGLLANLGNRAMFRMGTNQDYSQLAADMNLNAQQKAWAKGHLQPGMMIYTNAEGPWRQPVLVSVPHFKLPAIVTDDQVHDSLKHLSHLPVVRATEYDNFTADEKMIVPSIVPHIVPPEAPGISPSTATVTPTQSTTPITTTTPSATPRMPSPLSTPPSQFTGSMVGLSDDELRLLSAIQANPGCKWKQYPKLASMNAANAAQIRDRLLDQKYLRLTEVAVSGRGRNAHFLTVTDKGEQAMQSKGGIQS